jgi:hypothetical protein
MISAAGQAGRDADHICCVRPWRELKMLSNKAYNISMKGIAGCSRRKSPQLFLPSVALLLAVVMLSALPLHAGQEKPPGSALKVTGIKNQMKDGKLIVSGTLANIGSREVKGISVSIVALDSAQKEVGKKIHKVNQGIWPGGSLQFKAELPIGSMPDAVRVFVNAPVERVIFDS